MPIPDFQSLMLPVLQFAADGQQHVLKDLRHRLAGDLMLTAEELGEKLRNGTGLFANRVAWTVSYLSRAGTIEAASRGVYRITERGRALLKQKPGKITVKLLL